MKKILPGLFFLFFGINLSGQNLSFEWAKRVGGAATDVAYNCVTDTSGNVYSIGEFRGNFDFDPGPAVFFLNSLGVTNTFILKLTKTGDFVWAKQIRQLSSGDNYGGSITIDSVGAIYFSVQFWGIIDADPGAGMYAVGSILSIGESMITKLDAAGNFVWAKYFGGANSGISDIVFDKTGYIYATGFFQGTVDFDPGPLIYGLTSNGFGDIFILKLTSDGNFSWAEGMGAAGGDFGNSIAVDNLGAVYCTGFFLNTVDFDPGAGTFNLTTPGTPGNTFISKFDQNGNFLWAKQVVSLTSNSSRSLTVDKNDNISLTGNFAGTADFDPGPGIFNYTASLGDIFILKLNTDGLFVWAKQLTGTGNSGGYGIIADLQENLYICGIFTFAVDFDPGPGTANLVSFGGYDAFLLELDKTGNFVWVKQIGGPGTQDFASRICKDNSGCLFVSGAFESTADFDPSQSVYNLTSAGNKDGFIVKFSACVTKTYSSIIASACDTYTLNGITYNSTGIYTQTLQNTAGCDSIITLDLSINKKFTTVNKDICQGESFFAGGTLQTTSGIYYDTLITSLGCDSVITTFLTVHLIPKPDLGPDRRLCADLSASISPGIFSGYLWQDNSTQPNYTVNIPGMYWVKVTDANNCSATDTLNIISIDTIPKNFLPPDQELCYGNVLRISAGSYFTYQWSTGDIGDFIDIKTFGTFYLTVKDWNLCTGTDSITIQRKDCIYIGIPNAFTPNGDTKNDIFKPIIFQEVKAFSFIVFNRYGQKVFETREYGKGWDGTYKGKDQPAGSYVYRIKFTNVFGWEYVENGSVLLIR